MKEELLESRLKAIVKFHEDLLRYPAGIDITRIEDNLYWFNTRIGQVIFRLQVIKKDSKVSILSKFYTKEIDDIELEPFLKGYIYTLYTLYLEIPPIPTARINYES